MIHLEKQYWRHSKEVLVSRTIMLFTKPFPETPPPPESRDHGVFQLFNMQDKNN